VIRGIKSTSYHTRRPLYTTLFTKYDYKSHILSATNNVLLRQPALHLQYTLRLYKSPQLAKYRLQHGLRIGYDTAANALHELIDHYRVYRSCETDAVRGPAARPFVQDAQSVMRLPESRSRRSRDLLSGSRMALCASRTNSLAADRRTASVSQLR